MKKIKFGRLYKPDERDRLHLMAPNLIIAAQREWRYWHTGDPIDQGGTPQCVGYSGFKYLTSGPVRNTNLPFTPTDVYHGAQKNDEWPGEDYAGSSVRGCFKWLRKEGYVSEYQWAWDVGTIAAQILAHGPVVVGTNWYEWMMQPNSIGIIKPIGNIVGGHAYVLCGVNKAKEKFRIINSWGADWGNNGRAWIRFEDFQRLLDEDGEACIAKEILK